MSEMKTFALIGNPNCGKTTLFNSLTGSTAHVGNWPGVTVEKREGDYRKNKKSIAKIIDLPGIYSLSPYTSEEIISRNFLLKEKPDCIINVIDVMNIDRSLYLTSELFEMDIPLIIALNMVDVLDKNHMSIDIKKIQERVNVPVICISALKFANLDKLMEEAISCAEKKREGKLVFSTIKEDEINRACDVYKEYGISDPLFHSIRALQGDIIEQQENKFICDKIKELNLISDDFEKITSQERYKNFSDEIEKCIIGEPLVDSQNFTRSDKIDKVLTHKIFGIPILLVILFLIFHLTFGTDLFYLHSMGVQFEEYQGYISFTDASGELFRPFASLFYSEGGIPTIGDFFKRLIEGINSLIIEGLRLGLTNLSASDWVVSFVCDGVLNGVFSVISFLPQILILFAFFTLLEDSGYMARVAFILDRFFRKLGVSGRAFIPMIMGFGCSVPAMINTRTLNSDKEKIKAIRTIPFFACSAKSEILIAIASVFASSFAFDAGIFTFLIYLLGMSVAIISIIMMNKTSLKEKTPPFIMELPSYQRPQLYSLLLHVSEKGKHFIKKAFTIILFSTIGIWLFTNFTFDWKFIPVYSELDISSSILANVSKLIQPIFTPLGFGSQLKYVKSDGSTVNNGWIFALSSFQGVIAKENVVSTLGTLSGFVSGSEGNIQSLISVTGITKGGLISFVAFNILTIPCMAAVATAKIELNSKKSFKFTILFWLVVSYFVSSLLYVMIDYMWTMSFIIPLLILLFFTVLFFDRIKEGFKRIKRT
ncbi:MAG: ferrous iron transporter B [Bacilli bacterium]|nr:ferrous iron transporter B [Bacilli bacterium]